MFCLISFSFFCRQGHFSPGPNLPTGIKFPCTQNIGQDMVFIFGETWGSSNETLSLIFHQSNLTFKNVPKNPCNIKYPPIYGQYSCAYLKRKNSVIITIESCTAILDLNALTWTSFESPMKHGVIFNSNWDFDEVLFIASGHYEESHLYVVSNREWVEKLGPSPN